MFGFDSTAALCDVLHEIGASPRRRAKRGHGPHVATIIGGAPETIVGQPFGLAPMTKLVVAEAFEVHVEGKGSYSTVISGMNRIPADLSR